MTFDKSIERCSTYSYSVTSVTGKISSQPQEINLVIPPDTQTLPQWNIQVEEKMATIDFEIPKVNVKCRTRGFEIYHNANGTESVIISDEGSGIIIDLTEAEFHDKVKISGRILYEDNSNDNSDPKYITETVTLEEATTTSTSTTRKPTTKKPVVNTPAKIQEPTHSKSVDLGPTWILINFMCVVATLIHCCH